MTLCIIHVMHVIDYCLAHEGGMMQFTDHHTVYNSLLREYFIDVYPCDYLAPQLFPLVYQPGY